MGHRGTLRVYNAIIHDGPAVRKFEKIKDNLSGQSYAIYAQ